VQENEGHAFLEHGSAEKECRRGSQGVAIALSLDARRAWERAGSQRPTSGPRILTTRLVAVDPAKRPLTISLVSACAPDSGQPGDEKEARADNLQRCIQARGSATLVVGTDAKASIEVRNSHDARGTAGYRVCGQHGTERQNVAGHRLRTFLGANGLCAATASFRKIARGGHASAYGTWHHFRTGESYQLGHFFVKRI